MATKLATLIVNLKADSSGLTQGFNKAKAAGLALGAALVGIATKGVKAFDVQVKAEQSLLTALKGREDVQKRLIRQASQLQGITLFGDEETIQAQSFLAQLGLTEDAILKLTPLIQDFATAQGVNLTDAAKLVAKSVGSSTNALSRYGIEVEGAVGSNERLNSAVTSLTEAFGGQAKAAAEVGLGPFKQLQNSIGDLFEIIGKAITPAVKVFSREIKALVERVNNSASSGGGFIKLQAALVAAVDVFKLLFKAVRAGIGPVIGLLKGIQAIALAVQGKFKKAAEAGKVAISEFAKPFELYKDLGKNVTGIVDTYNTTLDRLNKTAGAATTTQNNYNKTITTGAKAVEEYKNEVTGLGEALEAFSGLFAQAQERYSQPLPTIGQRIPGQVSSTTDQEGDVSEIIGRTIENADALSEAYERLTPLQGDLLSAGEQGFATIGNLMVDMITLSEGIGSAFQKMGKALIGIFADVLKSLVKVVAKALALATIGNLLTGGAFGGFKGILQALLKGGIPQLADGGLVNSPTLAVVGEKGPELVIPLNKLNEFGIQQVSVTGRIDGNDIALLMDRQNEIRSRRRGDI